MAIKLFLILIFLNFHLVSRENYRLMWNKLDII